MNLQPSSTAATGWGHWSPALGWLRTDQPRSLRADLVAGLTLAAYLLPAGLAAEFEAAGVRRQVIEMCSSARDRLRHEGVEEQFGGINRFTSGADAVETAGALARVKNRP